MLYDVGLPLAFIPFIFHPLIVHTQNKEFKRDIALLPKIVDRTRKGRLFFNEDGVKKEKTLERSGQASEGLCLSFPEGVP